MLPFLSLLCAFVLIVPLATVLASIFRSGGDTWSHLAATVLPGYIANSAALAIMVGVGTFVVGTGCAWLVTSCRFPGRDLFAWALVLPLAVPAYVIAYAYTDFLQHSGPVQSLLRDLTGWGPRDYWFPNIRSTPGAAAVFVAVFYPYVYMLARAGFLRQSSSAFEAARTLGRSPWGAFFAVSLPMARPAIAGGVALAVMETLADFGAVSHFGVPTFTTGIYRAWFALGDRLAATHLAVGLVVFVFVVLVLERWQRLQVPNRAAAPDRPFEPMELRGWRAAAATTAVATPLIIGFILPLLILVNLAAPHVDVLFTVRYRELVTNSILLAAGGTTICVSLALIFGYAARLHPGKVSSFSNRLVTLGYAMPGSIIAIGILIPLASFDNWLDGFARATFNISTGLLLTGSIAALLYAYSVRFMAVALNAVEAGLATITASMDHAARTLGSGTFGTLARVHIPIIRGGLFTAALLLFVDVMKELPATLILRPFNFDTVAVQAYRLASDERLAEAAVPSLVLVAVGLIPVLILGRAIASSRS